VPAKHGQHQGSRETPQKPKFDRDRKETLMDIDMDRQEMCALTEDAVTDALGFAPELVEKLLADTDPESAFGALATRLRQAEERGIARNDALSEVARAEDLRDEYGVVNLSRVHWLAENLSSPAGWLASKVDTHVL